MGYASSETRLNALTTDLYQLTMAQGFFNKGKADDECVYYMHWRTPPFKSGTYVVAAGLEEFIDYLNNFKFTDDDIAFLASVEKKGKRLFTREFLEYLKDIKLNLDVDAIPEGAIMTSAGPVVRVTGPLVQCQIVESALLNIINRNSIIATKGSRVHEAADGVPFANFGLRRASEIDLGYVRSAHIGGSILTADVDAARHLGITPTGTMAHAWIMNFQEVGRSNAETELEAFKTYLTNMSNNTVLLVDTYEPKQGIRNAIRAAIETGIPLDGIRLDSGDLFELTWYAKEELDKARVDYPEIFKDTRTFLTDGLDEDRIITLFEKLDQKNQSVNGEIFPRKELALGVGTELANTGPFRGGVYKVCAHAITVEGEVRMEPAMKVAGVNPADPKLPSSKASIPGEQLDVLRLWKEGKIVADIIIDHSLGDYRKMLEKGIAISMEDNKTEVALPAFDKAETLLVPVFKRNQGISEYVFNEPPKKTLYNGKQITDIDAIRAHHLEQKAALPEEVRRIVDAKKLPVLIDPAIHERRICIIEKTNSEQIPTPETSGQLTAAGNVPERKIA